MQVFAADIFASKFHDSYLNQYVGMQFRNKVKNLLNRKKCCHNVSKTFLISSLTNSIHAFRRVVLRCVDLGFTSHALHNSYGTMAYFFCLRQKCFATVYSRQILFISLFIYIEVFSL